MEISQFDWQLIWFHSYHLLAAFLLALPLGWDREKSSRSFGLRTFPLVAVVTCGFMMLGISVIHSTDGEARIFQGIITGIGFIGGGSILTSSEKSKEPQLRPRFGIQERLELPLLSIDLKLRQFSLP